MMRSRAVKIYQFNPLIYPVKIWITITTDLDAVVRKFWSYPGLNPINPIFSDKMERFAQIVVDKKTGLFGVLLVFSSKKVMTAGKIAHEATHAARDIWEHLSERSTGVEADAYLVEWISDCADKVRRGIKK